jgi:rhodanese-related sulfurtransferase
MTTPPTLGSYAGDIGPPEAWELLATNAAALLIDVRTTPEWTFVGLPDLSSLGRAALCVEWQQYPSGINPDFVQDVVQAARGAAANKDVPLLFLCRSGARSRAAAIAMTQAGFSRAYNVAGGFEGNHDAQGHRGTSNGWKAANLPWRQS